MEYKLFGGLCRCLVSGFLFLFVYLLVVGVIGGVLSWYCMI